jgi:hypothetical protein
MTKLFEWNCDSFCFAVAIVNQTTNASGECISGAEVNAQTIVGDGAFGDNLNSVSVPICWNV